MLYEYEVKFSKTERIDNRISCEVFVEDVIAESEDEVLQILKEEDPDIIVDEIKVKWLLEE